MSGEKQTGERETERDSCLRGAHVTTTHTSTLRIQICMHSVRIIMIHPTGCHIMNQNIRRSTRFRGWSEWDYHNLIVVYVKEGVELSLRARHRD